MGISDRLSAFEAENRQIAVAYGGDGTLASRWRGARKEKKIVFPVRDYGLCETHRKMYEAVFSGDASFKDMKQELKMTLHPPVRCEFPGHDLTALSEFFIGNADITEAVRTDVVVNGETYLENVISSGIVVASAFGATGYWSSVARTIFRSGYGIAFVAPTVGVSNVVLGQADKAEVVVRRGFSACVGADKEIVRTDAPEGTRFRFESSSDNVPIIGLRQFHCNACRAARNGTILSNQYLK